MPQKISRLEAGRGKLSRHLWEQSTLIPTPHQVPQNQRGRLGPLDLLASRKPVEP